MLLRIMCDTFYTRFNKAISVISFLLNLVFSYFKLIYSQSQVQTVECRYIYSFHMFRMFRGILSCLTKHKKILENMWIVNLWVFEFKLDLGKISFNLHHHTYQWYGKCIVFIRFLESSKRKLKYFYLFFCEEWKKGLAYSL